MTAPWPDAHNLAFVEELFARWVEDPRSVDGRWQAWFGEITRGERPAARLGPTFRPPGLFDGAPPRASARPAGDGRANGRPREASPARLQDRVDQLIRAYRVRGHRIARLDPLDLPREPQPELDPAFYGFTEEDLDRSFSVETIGVARSLTLREILERLRDTYCRTIGVQFMHIDSLVPKDWLTTRMEYSANRLELSREEQLRILTRLTDAVIFEEFVQKKYLGAKSFSLEGCESLIPLLDLAFERAAEHGIEEIVIGMAHRGRLNVLANVLGKSPREIFREFEDADPELHFGRGDVKYHLGHSSDWHTASGRTLHLALCFNPSHLEFVNPVALGRMRAKQDAFGDPEGERGMVLLIHGDAAFAGEGIVQETLNLSELRHFRTGGTIHVVVNNQLGFTTDPVDGRSTTYATDVAKMLQSPIFHVNGEDPEAVAQVVKLAVEFRSTFHRDVIIDMYGYRRRGHNEGDEPAFTQPLLYRAVRQRSSVREGYLEHLLKLGGVTREEADEIAVQRREQLEAELSAARSRGYRPAGDAPTGVWRGYRGGPERRAGQVDTGLPAERLADLLERTTRPPEGFTPHPKIVKLLEARREMAAGERPLDWAAGEALALASLAVEGYRVRLSGQDSERGTFSHRHAVLHDVETGARWSCFSELAPEQAPVLVLNSPLSEAGVLGFEYGYSLDAPDALVIWEAQFGDFCNAAQVIIDQFVVSAEDKWNRLSGLTLLLPHGFEGMGPEHSSARLERFLMLSVEDNLQVVNPTTPAQLFHLLRRQMLRRWRKPLVIMSPKSLLRHPRVRSELAELAEGAFRPILPDRLEDRSGRVERVLLCSGKIYYELEEEREELSREGVAILRLEQLYPLSEEALRAALAPYADGTPVFWVQEEPENMGAWSYLRLRLGPRVFDRLPFAGIARAASASPATGSAASHRMEQRELVQRAFGGS